MVILLIDMNSAIIFLIEIIFTLFLQEFYPMDCGLNVFTIEYIFFIVMV